jgi:hypothetical protein
MYLNIYIYEICYFWLYLRYVGNTDTVELIFSLMVYIFYSL